jgi:hypothetical protein
LNLGFSTVPFGERVRFVSVAGLVNGFSGIGDIVKNPDKLVGAPFDRFTIFSNRVFSWVKHAMPKSRAGGGWDSGPALRVADEEWRIDFHSTAGLAVSH